MKIYTALSPFRFERCHPLLDEDFETIIVQINGQPRRDAWRPLAMQLFREEEGLQLMRSDSPWFGSDALMFRPAAILALGPLLREHGELLPLRCDDAEVWMFNPWLLDALDEDASTIVRFSDGGIMDISRPVFRPDVIRGVHTFKIPQRRASPAYLSQHFVDAWHAAGLQGLEFTPVWSSGVPAPTPAPR